MRFTLRSLACSAVLMALPLLADTVTMKNGDKLTGTIVKYDGKELTFKAEFAGSVVIPWDAVTAVTSDKPVNFGLKDGQMVVGTVKTEGDKFVVVTQDTGTVSAAKANVTSIRSQDEQKAYDAEIERYKNPKLTDLWAGFADLGYSLSRGNSYTNNLAVGASAVRATKRDKIEVTFASLYASNEVNGVKSTTANAIRGSIGYSLDITPKWFGWGAVSLEYDQFQNLDLRFSPKGGLGYHAIKNDNTALDLLLGVSLNREFFSDHTNRTSAEIVFGDTFDHKFSKVTSIHQRLAFFPNLTDSGQYRGNFDIAGVTALKKWLSWQLTFSDRYLSNPVNARKKNDIVFTTGLRLTFAR